MLESWNSSQFFGLQVRRNLERPSLAHSGKPFWQPAAGNFRTEIQPGLVAQKFGPERLNETMWPAHLSSWRADGTLRNA